MATAVIDNLSSRPVNPSASPGLRIWFWLSELSGSLGDLGTLLPLALALTITTDLDFGAVFIWAGAANILAGCCFRQPIPVQPMKALAAVAITQQLSRGEIAAAGLLVALFLIVLAGAGALDRVAGWIPKPLIRAVQLGIGLRLMLTGFEWLLGFKWAGLSLSLNSGLPLIGSDSLVVALAAAGLLCLPRIRHIPMLLPVFAAGLVLAVLASPPILILGGFAWPDLTLHWPTSGEWKRGLLQAGLPQLPLTLMNSVVAVCALSSDFFPGAGVRHRRMALQVGAINLITLPFGAMPMCHGAGGLAAQHRFGARAGLSSVLLGLLMVAAALLVGAAAPQLLTHYPKSILAVMLILAGWTLAKVARDCMAPGSLVVLAPTVVAILLLHAAFGFLVGAAIAAILAQRSRRRVPLPARRSSKMGESQP